MKQTIRLLGCVVGVFLVVGNIRANGYGTAFFISPDGHLVTNFHVVDGADSIEIRYREKWLPVKAVRQDPVNDVAVLKAEGNNYPSIPVLFSADVRPGDPVFTIGFPDPDVLGFAAKTTRGEISALSGIKDDPRFVQTTAAIQPGNSGGPLCDLCGNVVGITSSSVNPFRRIDEAGYIPQNVNFALKVLYAKPLVESIPSLSGILQKVGNVADFRRAQEAVENTVVPVRVASRPKTKGRLDIDTDPESIIASQQQDKALAADPIFERVKAQEREENWFEMIETAKQIVLRYPNSALAHRVLSDACFYTELLNDALREAQTARDLDPTNARSWNNLYVILNRLGNEEEASLTQQEALKRFPNDVKILLEYAEMTVNGSPQIALRALRRAAELLAANQGTDIEVESYNLEFDVAQALLMAGDSESANKLVEVATGRADTDPGIWILKGQMARELGDSSSAYEAFSKAYSRSSERDPVKVDAITGILQIFEEDDKLNFEYQRQAFFYISKLKQFDPELAKEWESWATQRFGSERTWRNRYLLWQNRRQ